MEFNSITFGVSGVITLVIGITGALRFWFKMTGKFDLLEAAHDALNDDHKEFKEMINMRVNGIKDVVEKNRERSESNVTELKQLINDMKVEIIREIHENK